MSKCPPQIQIMNDPTIKYILESRKRIYHKKGCSRVWLASPRSISGTARSEYDLQSHGFKPCPDCIGMTSDDLKQEQENDSTQPPNKPRTKHDIFVDAIKDVCADYGMTAVFDPCTSSVSVTYCGKMWRLDFGCDPVALRGAGRELRFDNVVLALEHIHLAGNKSRRVKMENQIEADIQGSSPHEVILAFASEKGLDEDALLFKLNIRRDEWEYDCGNCFSTMPAGLFSSLCDAIGVSPSTLLNVLARMDFEQ